MEVILLEKIRNLGGVGENISVKAGYGRNYLIPYGKAVMATSANIEKFSRVREELEKNAAEMLKIAEERATKLLNIVITVPARATEEGRLFGSITTSTIANALKDIGFDIKKSEVSMPHGPIRQIGEYDLALLLHTDVTVKIKVKVIASAEEN